MVYSENFNPTPVTYDPATGYYDFDFDNLGSSSNIKYDSINQRYIFSESNGYYDLAEDCYYNSSLVVIDSRLEDVETLVNGLKSNATSLVIDSKDNTIACITQTLAKNPVTSLHLVAHGSPGYLELGNTPLTTENLVEYQQYLRQWQVEEIVIYGCCVARDEDFLKRLQIFTGARVAGSKVPVGNTEKGGNWQLDYYQSSPKNQQPELAFVSEARLAYQGVLNLTSPEFIRGDLGDFTDTFLPILVAGDFDGDGFDDVVVGDRDTNRLTLFHDYAYNTGDSESTGIDFQTTNTSLDNLLGNSLGSNAFLSVTTVAGDFNQDGIDDLIVEYANESPQFRVLLGNATGKFTLASSFGQSSNFVDEIAAGDFNGDDALDIVTLADIASSGGVTENTNVEVLLGLGNGSFSSGSSSTIDIENEDIQEVTVDDFNQDGFDDLAVAFARRGTRSGIIRVLLADGSGGFNDPTELDVQGFEADSNEPYDVTAGDVNNDGFLDLVATVAYVPELERPNTNSTIGINGVANVFLGEGSGNFAVPSQVFIGDEPNNINIADVNGDSYQDLVYIRTVSFTRSNLEVILGDGTGSYNTDNRETVLNYYYGGDLRNLNIGDFNQDGVKDVATSLNFYNGSFTPSETQAVVLQNITLDRAPVFDETNTSFVVNENADVGVAVGTVPATDENGDTLTYSILSGNDPDGDSVGTFAISNTGEITVANTEELDFEGNAVYNLELQVSDGRLTDTATVAIDVQDIFEPTEVEDLTLYAFKASPIGTIVGNVPVITPEGSSSLTFAILNGDDPDGDGELDFSIDENTGEITVVDSLDFDEIFSAYQLTVEATNQYSKGTFSDTATVTIESEANVAPEGVLLDNYNVDENSEAGTVVGQVSADDPNAGDSHNFVLTSDAGGRFVLSGNELQVADGSLLDFETNISHTVRIRATDSGGLSVTKNLNISVNNLSDSPPTDIVAPLLQVPKNASANYVIGQLTTVDPDAEDTFTYELLDDAGGRFQIIADELQVAPNAQFDFENTSSYDIEVKTTDSTNLTFTKTLSVELVPIFLGGKSNDNLSGEDDDDRMFGNEGADTISGNGGNDRIDGGLGDDNLDGGNNDDFLQGGKGNDDMTGGEGKDFLLGEEGEDVIKGGPGEDVLMGGDDDDILYGGAGSDRMGGFAGNDVFVLTFGDTGNIIYDYIDGTDQLGIELSTFANNTVADVFNNELTVTQNGSNTEIYSNSGSDLLASLYNVTATDITVDDFISF